MTCRQVGGVPGGVHAAPDPLAGKSTPAASGSSSVPTGLTRQVDAYELAGDICMTALLGGAVGWMTGSLSQARWDYLLSWCGRPNSGVDPCTALSDTPPAHVSAPGVCWRAGPSPHPGQHVQAALALLGRALGHSTCVFGAE